MMGPHMGNNEYLMRAYRAAAQQQAALNQYRGQALANIANNSVPQASMNASTPGELPAEDVTGLRLLEEFLTRRKERKHGDADDR